MPPLKVNIISADGSAGRGVGFYAENLKTALSKIKTINLTDKNPDIVHYPFFDLFYKTLPLIKPKKTIVTIHDLTPLVLKNKYPKGVKGALSLIYQRLSLLNVKAIITDSNSSRQDILRLFKIPKEKVHVVYLSCNPVFSKPVSKSRLYSVGKKYHLPKKFILGGTGHPNPNKNLPLLAKVTKDLNIPLVLVGGGMVQEVPKGRVHPELQDLEKLRHFNHIIYPGFVPTEDLVAIYKLATLYCLPSLYEGFGITLLEAMSSGTLLVSSNTSSLPELYGNAALTFNPKSEKDLKKVLTKALKISLSNKNNLIEKGLVQAKKFNWRKAATQTASVYNLVSRNNR
jgi:glycosyltransferase involved in cell wall biosynthesis